MRPRIHHQWLPDEIAAEPFALSADARAKLEAMGHKIVEQTPWGANEAILIGLPAPPDGTESSGNDAMAGGKTLPGLLYGGHDSRRPAGVSPGIEEGWTFGHRAPTLAGGGLPGLWEQFFPGAYAILIGSCPCAGPWSGVNGAHLRK